MPEDNNSKDSMQNFDISDTLIEALLDFDDEPDFDEDDDAEGRPEQEPDDNTAAKEKAESDGDATSPQPDAPTDTAEKSGIDKDEAVTDTAELNAGQAPSAGPLKPDTSAHESGEAIESVEIQTAGSDPAEDILKLVLGADLDSTEGEGRSTKPREGQHQLAEQPEAKTLAPQNDKPIEEQTAPGADAGEGISQQVPGTDSDAHEASESTTEHPVQQKLLPDSPETETSAPEDDEPVEKQTVTEVNAREDIQKQVLGVDTDVQEEARTGGAERGSQQQRPPELPKTESPVHQDREPVEKKTTPDAEAGEKILQPVQSTDSAINDTDLHGAEQHIQQKAPSEPTQTDLPAPQKSEPGHDEPQTEELTDILAEAARKRGEESSGDKEPDLVKSGRPALPEPVPKAKVETRATSAETSVEEKQPNRQPDSDQGQHEIEEPTGEDRTPPSSPPNDDTLAAERKTKPVRENAQKSSSAGPLVTLQRHSSSASPDHPSEARDARPGPRAKTLPSLPAPQKRQLPTRPGPMQSAITFYKRGQYEDAITEFKRLLRVRPNYPSAYQLLGTAYLRNTMIAEAVEAYKKLKRLQPDNTHAYENLAWIYLNLGQLDKAAIEWAQLLKLAPDRHDIRQKLKQIQGEEPKSDVKLKSDPGKKQPDSVFEGIRHFRNANFDAALQAFEAHGKKQPQNPNVLGYIGSTYFKKDMMEQALSAYRKALLGKPNDVLFLENVALLELKLGHIQEALASLDELAKQNPYRADVKKLIMSLRSATNSS